MRIDCGGIRAYCLENEAPKTTTNTDPPSLELHLMTSGLLGFIYEAKKPCDGT